MGVTGIVAGVYITARRTQDQKRQELVASALSDYIMAAAKLVSAHKLNKFAQSLSDETRRHTVEKEALDAYRQSDEIAAQAKVRLLAFADSDVVENLASWDRDSSLADPHRHVHFWPWSTAFDASSSEARQLLRPSATASASCSVGPTSATVRRGRSTDRLEGCPARERSLRRQSGTLDPAAARDRIQKPPPSRARLAPGGKEDHRVQRGRVSELL